MNKLLMVFLFGLIGGSAFSQPLRNEWIDYSKTYYKFKVHFGTNTVTQTPNRKRLVKIMQPVLVANGLGSVLAQNFQLFRNGVEVPIYTSVASGILSATDYIEFWGEINDGKLDNDLYRNPDFQLSDTWSMQEDAGTYFLTNNSTSTNKRLVNTPNNAVSATIEPTMYFMNTVVNSLRQRRHLGFAAQAALPLYSSSYDRGEGYSTRQIRPIGSACGQVSFTTTVNNLKPYLAGPPMTLRVNSVGSANNPRSILVRLNGDTVSNYQMDYFFDAKIEEFGIPVSKIASGTASLQHINQSPVNCDEFRLVKNELVYPRSLDGNNLTSLEMVLPASANGHFLKFYNFNTGGQPPILYDLTNNKRYVANMAVVDTIRFLVEPSTTVSNLVLVNDNIANALSVPSLTQRNFTNYNQVVAQGNYLIITNPLIYGSGANNYVDQYKDYRNSAKGGSFNAKVIDINELTDQFAYGINKHPLSIRNFLRFSRSVFVEAPKFAFIIGKGLNYIDFKSNETAVDIEFQNLVPTWGHPASDNLLSAGNNENATPLTPIGRLSAVSAQEVGDYLLKVKQYDSLQQSPSSATNDKAWMKNILQIVGANDYTIATTLEGHMSKYKGIIQDTLFGGLVSSFDKIANPSSYTQSLKDFKQTYESGASLITYFGHSSSTSLDFNLDNPNAYNNQYKYPVFIVNGCDAGNMFLYESQRLSLKSTLSEKFVLAPQRGAIAYLATTNYGVVNYLDSFTTKIYKSLSTTDYNKSYGEAIKTGIGNILDVVGGNDFFARFHAEQYAFHGDPALKMNSFAKPDYAVEADKISVSPNFISIAKDSFFVKIKLFNIGKKGTDSVSFKLTRQFPNGSVVNVLVKKFASIAAIDSVTVAFPIVANRDKGINIITAFIDDGNSIDEITNSNNSASVNVNISEDELIPVYPYNFSIVTNPTFKLSASTANPFATSKTYLVEVDTTALFNSPLKYTQNKISVGGLIEFDNGISLQNNTTYYWRVAVQGSSVFWNVSSFTYKNSGSVGFEQKHFYQHTESALNSISLDSSSRKFEFKNKSNNLFMVHSIYPYSGTEDNQFSIQVNGSAIIASACLGSSVIINVFDTLTFKPWENLTNPYAAEATCAPNRKYNFEYAYTGSTERNNAKKFLDSIPNGTLVAVRLVFDGDPTWADQWAADTSIYGANNTLYHFLKKQGLPIDSFNRDRTFGIIFKKNDSTRFAPKYKFSDGLYDRVIMSVDFDAKDTLGYITSPKFGPSKAWQTVKWNGKGSGNNFASMNVIGIAPNGSETRLFTIDTLQTSFNISSISVAQYPYIRLSMKNKDSVTAKAYQLNNWSIEYSAAAEGAIAPNLYYNIPDSAGIATSIPSDTLKGGIAFKNVSKVNFDSLTVKVVLQNLRLGDSYTYNLPKSKPLNMGDTINVNFALSIGTLPDDNYNLYLVINDGGTQTEQFLFNNFMYKYVYLKNNRIVPVTLLNFSAKPMGTTVEASWSVAEEINMQQYQVEHSINAQSFNPIGSISARNISGNLTYSYRHLNPVAGKNYYRLKMLNKDGSYTFSPVKLINFAKGISVNIYPNPVVNQLQIVVSKTDSKINTIWLYNNVGQLLVTKQFAVNTQINMEAFAAGNYLIKIDNGSTIETQNIQKR